MVHHGSRYSRHPSLDTAALVAGLVVLGGCQSFRANPAARSENSPRIEFHQHWVESRWLDGASHRQAAIDLDDPLAVARWILERIPEEVIVYPTEQYYYFEFDLGTRQIAGNLRFCDADKGLLNIGYFDRADAAERWMRHSEIGVSQGVSCELRVHSDHQEVKVHWGDLTRRFVLPTAVLAPPPALELFPGERHVSGVLDESGFTLDLVYYEPTSDLYFLLREDAQLPEPLSAVSTNPSLAIGRDSGFVFLTDSQTRRSILVGVVAKQIERNSYFDGPFDQVPPRLQLKQILETTYPYVKERGGIDAHGNFVGIQGQRVAICPYQVYSDIAEFAERLTSLYDPSLNGPERWLKCVYESKRDFHLKLQEWNATPPVHSLERSRLWPANHYFQSSITWPTEGPGRPATR